MTQSLLKIDVDLEIRKLTQNRFKTSTEWAVALCRYAMGRGCTSLSLQLETRTFELQYSGTEIEFEDLQRLGIIFDSRQLPDVRHHAIVALEEGDSFDLLCAFYLKKADVEIRSAAGRLQVSRRKPPALLPAADSIETGITVRSSKFKRRALEQAVRTACRFSPVPVLLNGERISGGYKLENCFAQRVFDWNGVCGVVGIPMESDFVRQVTLKNGITVKDTLRQPAYGMLYHAVIDNPGSTHMDELRNVVRSVYRSLGKSIETMDAATRTRALEVLFIRYQETLDISYVKGVRAFEQIDGKRFSMEELQQKAARRPIYAVPIEHTSMSWNLVGRQTLVLDARQWNFLEKELAVRIVAPPLRRKSKRCRVQDIRSGNPVYADAKPFSKEIRSAAEQLLL